MSESIVFTSGKGGVGKTTAVAHIGKELASAGKRTAVLDKMCIRDSYGNDAISHLIGYRLHKNSVPQTIHPHFNFSMVYNIP